MSIMSVHFNAPAMNLYRNLSKNSKNLNKNIEKLSSGFRINTADDGPADLIQSEKLRSQIAGLEQAIKNVTTSSDVMSIAEGGLGQVQSILQEMKKHAIQALNSGVTSPEQIAASQAMIDSGMQSFERILATTSYAGRKLLDNINTGFVHKNQEKAQGELDENAANVVMTPRQYLQEMLEKQHNGENSDLIVNRDVKFSAESRFDENGNTIADTTVNIKGYNGDEEAYQTFTFAAGTNVSDIVQAVKGYSIPQDDLDELAQREPEYDIRYEYVEGETDFREMVKGRAGDDINTVDIDANMLDFIKTLDDDKAEEFIGVYMDKFATLDGVEFLEAGDSFFDNLTEGERKLLELSDSLMAISSGSLGAITTEDGKTYHLADIVGWGGASLKENPAAALDVINQAIKDVAAHRASIGATQKYALDAMEENLRNQMVHLQASESYIRDTDYAKEVTDFTRNQILQQTGTRLLAAANQHGQNILDLLA